MKKTFKQAHSIRKINHGYSKMKFLLLFLLTASAILPCTTFVLKSTSGVVIAENYDFYYGQALIVKNRRNVSKQSFGLKDSAPKKWKSRYGSISFNQFGIGLPTAGMNEKGLVIALMWTSEGEFPESAKKSGLNELQWIQYALDNFANTKSLLVNLKNFLPRKDYKPLHYLVCDASNDCAYIDFDKKGNLRIIHKKNMPIAALTNHSYQSSLAYFEKYKNTDYADLPSEVSSLNQFAKAAWLVKHQRQKQTKVQTIEKALSYLKKVSLDYSWKATFRWLFYGEPPSVTQWSIVYNPRDTELFFVTRTNPNRRKIKLKNFNFSCQSPMEIYDIEKQDIGPISHKFIPYKHSLHVKLIEESYEPVEDLLTEKDKERLARYPESFRCPQN